MAANMDGVGELGVAEKLSEFNMITCLTKQHDIKKLKQYKKIKSIYKNIALSVGIKKEDFDNLDRLLKEFNFIKFICIDVANGYSERFSKFIKSVRDKYPTKTINEKQFSPENHQPILPNTKKSESTQNYLQKNTLQKIYNKKRNSITKKIHEK